MMDIDPPQQSQHNTIDPPPQDNLNIKDSDVREIVLSYLVHNCFTETAESFIASTGMEHPAGYLADMDKRKAIFQFALEGNALKAMELTDQLIPTLLTENQGLYLDLLSLHFVELVCARKCTEALDFAKIKLQKFGEDDSYRTKVEDIMALLAYEEPELSPVYPKECRFRVADSLNRAILAHANLPSQSAMERLIQQTTAVRQCLHVELGKDGPSPFSLKAFLES